MNVKFADLLSNVAKERKTTLEDLIKTINGQEIVNRENEYPKLSALLLASEIDIGSLRKIGNNLLILSKWDMTPFQAFLNDPDFSQDAILSLIRDFPLDDVSAGKRIDTFIEQLINFHVPDGQNGIKESQAGLFCSLLLTAAFPERFVDFRQSRWVSLAKMLEYELPIQGSSYGQLIVWAGKFAQEIAKTATFQKHWRSEHPLWAAAGLCWNFRNGEIKPPKVVNNRALNRQIILYGPPGTGKTYNSIIRAHEILFGYEDNSITYRSLQDKLRAVQKQEIDLSQLSWRKTILLAFDEIKKKKVQVGEIKDSKIIHDYSLMTNNHSIRSTIWNILLTDSKLDSETVKIQKKSGNEYFDKDLASNWYLTDKGNEYLNTLLDDLKENSTTSDSQFSFVTFHQSFSYEDFVEGIRPDIEDTESSQISYRIKDGIFKEICKKAAFDHQNNYVLIIDEINRGNISKIFGELITLLEDNKRTGEKEEITVKLPYSGQEFSVPKNVYIIGTMNSTDKSIALVDVALRRRFIFERLNVRYSKIDNEDAKTFLTKVNSIIRALKNPDYEIGHSYFMDIPKSDPGNVELKKIFASRILPLLEEYFFNDWEALATILGADSINIEKRQKVVWDEDSGTFGTKTGDYDQIYGRWIRDPDDVFDNTLENLRTVKIQDNQQ
jgi:5-methylcytosine-specific restriction endonuclease McrBC GTP-binding regulatory subunit McrB